MYNLYEIHVATWLSRLSEDMGNQISLSSVPDCELDRIAGLGMDSVWLMGIWERSPAAAEINRSDNSLVDHLKALLPDYSDSDIIGSAYSIKSYTVDQRFGTDVELIQLRQRFASRGMRLVLDFVPNHTAPDNAWLHEHPDYYITSSYEQVDFRKLGDKFFALGKDPTLDAWNDVIQLNAFSPGYRAASIETLKHLASMCDGVRCDMAMLMLSGVFAEAWHDNNPIEPTSEYWQEVITSVKQVSPEFVFIAESYWNTEALLVTLGFDYCYDKPVYDYLVKGDFTAVETRIKDLETIKDHLVHFIENHDEQRAAQVFSVENNIAAAKYIASLPGMHLWHDGQCEGYRKHTPVHVQRGPVEPTNQTLLKAYRALLS